MPNYAKSPSGHRPRVVSVTLTEAVNNFAPTQLDGNGRIITSWADCNLLRIDTDGGGPYDITGLSALAHPDTGVLGIPNGSEVTIAIVGGTGVNFPNQSGSSEEQNRLINDGSFAALLAGTLFRISYDAVSERWRFPQIVT